ncbi:LOW QUALITY PROTEIN: MFS general substrate transporter [Testicularia cyperi]|uniref:Lysosomal dipeptide transporter MFSD1 n=1 Tax=Testicularia cyperi TaxID=1882483 RepID=A0A317XU67_9BASI|nr:LOW QUALITY PROTEIN: MFS general substrate transporter [Testicularia cyperi]
MSSPPVLLKQESAAQAASPPETPEAKDKVESPWVRANEKGREASQGSDGDEDTVAVHPGVGAVGATWKQRIPALLIILFLTLGSNFAQSSLSPLKSTLKKEIKGVTNARYGAIASADSLINGVLPIFSGIVIDYYGPSMASIWSSTFILLGTVLRAIGGTVGSFSLILGGQIIFGLGSTTIETAQSKLYTHWARGSVDGGAGWMGFIYGLDIAMGRVFNLMGRLSSIPIGESTGKWYWSFWVSAILCAVTLLLNVAYVILERSLPERMRVVTGRQIARRSAASDADAGKKFKPLSKRHFKYISISIAAIPAAFWLVTMSQILQAGTVNAYTSNLAEMVEVTRGTTKLTAGYTSSLSQVIPIVLTPLVGLAFDLFGRRMYYVSATAALWVLVFSLLGFSDVHPLAPVILGSVALSSNAIPFIASIPLLVPSQISIGTAFGIWKAFNSAGSTIMDVSTGAIQDLTPTGTKQYSNVFYFLIALKSVDVLFGLGYHMLDKRYFGGFLLLNEKQRINKEAEETEKHRMEGLRKPIRSWTLAGCCLLSAMVVTSYVVYVVYSIGT